MSISVDGLSWRINAHLATQTAGALEGARVVSLEAQGENSLDGLL
jgi:hypothetical protein